MWNRFNWRDCQHVERDPEIRSGAWCFEGTRLPVATLFSNLASGLSIPEFMEQFPSARADQINAVLNFHGCRLRTQIEAKRFPFPSPS